MNSPRGPFFLPSLLCLALTSFGAEFAVTEETLSMTSERIEVRKSMAHLIDITTEIGYRPEMKQKDYPDFIEMKAVVEKAAVEFGADRMEDGSAWSWEELAPALATRVLEDYPNVTEATLTVTVPPTPMVAFETRITCSLQRSDDGVRSQRWVTIPIERYGIDHQGPNVIDLVTLAYLSDEAEPADMPRFKTVREELIAGMESYPVESDYWETLIKVLSADLLESHPAYGKIVMRLNVHPTATLTYPHEVTSTTARRLPPRLRHPRPSSAPVFRSGDARDRR